VFHDVWSVKLPWAEFVVDEQGKVDVVKCKVCSKIDDKDKMFAYKIDNLWKHVG
jgi:hypothetical protein